MSRVYRFINSAHPAASWMVCRRIGVS